MAQKKKSVSRTLADGTVKTYTYERKRKEGGASIRTVESIARAYRMSPAFTKLRPNSKRNYERALNHIIDTYGNVDIKAIKRRHVLALRDSIAEQPARANQVHVMFGVILQFAVDREYIDYHPALRIKALSTGEYATWPPDLVEQAIAPGGLPEWARRAVVLGLNTGQREGDCIRMTWADYDGSAIRVVQEKTGAKLWIPCHATLRAELAAWRQNSESTTLLVRSNDKPWRDGPSFATMFSRCLRARSKAKDGKREFLRPEFVGYVFHGLRKVAAARLAEAGCSVHEIAAITGHATLAMVEHYTKAADQRRRASAAITKLENFRQ
ncbi:integrase [Azospirillum cavernae]|uniref:Integrase n=1 Tax=Azospirillum cavernae TaxID=2320860 RepID=A0A418VYR2_9PROT|nr:tyrosine-type recombinase/integrase [Azospirillum cavernae]RJF82308.1 integrase [Azospirillum cavernae]